LIIPLILPMTSPIAITSIVSSTFLQTTPLAERVCSTCTTS
jgi:hypothetical protein